MSLRHVLKLVTPALAALLIAAFSYLGAAHAAGTRSVASSLGYAKCIHYEPSDWYCPDTSKKISIDASDILSATLTISTRSRGQETLELKRGTDAVFLTKAATEKFLLSYYYATNRAKAVALTRYLDTH